MQLCWSEQYLVSGKCHALAVASLWLVNFLSLKNGLNYATNGIKYYTVRLRWLYPQSAFSFEQETLDH